MSCEFFRKEPISGTLRTPYGLTWTASGFHRPRDLVAPHLIDYQDDFVLGNGQYGEYVSSGDTLTVSHDSGGMQLNPGSSSGVSQSIVTMPAGPKTPFFAVQVRVPRIDTGGSAAEPWVGIAQDLDDYLVAEFDFVNNEIKIFENISGGGASQVGSTFSFGSSLEEGDDIALVVCGTRADAYARRRSGFASGVMDFFHATGGTHSVTLDASTIGNFRYAVGNQAADNTREVRFTGMYAGTFGGLSYRDPYLITRDDGAPLVDDQGRVFVTMTTVGLNASLHTGVFRFDLKQNQFEKTGAIITQANGGNTFYGQIAQKWLWDTDARCFRGFLSSQNTGGNVRVEMVTYEGDVRFGTHIIERPSSALTLPGSGTVDNQYDADVIRVGNTWYMAYTHDPTGGTEDYRPALASSSDLSSWSLVWEDTTNTTNEGTKFVKMGDVWRVVACDRTTARFYPLTSATPDGTEALSGLQGGVSSPDDPPHVLIIPYRVVDGKTSFKLISFDDAGLPTAAAGEYGGIHFFDGSDDQDGHEFSQFVFPPSHDVQLYVTEETGNFSLSLDHFRALPIEVNSGSAVVVTIPANSTTDLPLDEFVGIDRMGAGTVTITAAAGVTLSGGGSSATAGSSSIADRYASAVLRQVATDSWLIQGNISAVS